MKLLSVMQSIVFGLLLSCLPLSYGQQQADPDWPCIQVLIPKISAAAIWDGPQVDELQADALLDELSSEIVPEVVNGQALSQDQVESYIGNSTGQDRNYALSYLFKRILGGLNSKRASQIESIKRYTRNQRQSAQTIEGILDQIAELKSQSDTDEQLTELESELHWQKRMFKEREATFKYLCEIPQEILQQAGNVARIISANLEY